MFAIFGHGNVLGLGNALEEVRDQLPVWRGHNEQGMALAAVGIGKATHRRQVGVATSSIGPGALNMVTAAGVAHANRLPLLLLPGDTFTSRAPDPVLQQVEHFHDPTTTVNDAFRAVSRYFDRITRPEQLLGTLPQVARVLTDPADCGPVTLALPQDVQAESFDFPDALFEPVVHRLLRQRPDLHALAEAASRHPFGLTPAAGPGRRRPLLGCRRPRPAFRRAARHPDHRDHGGPHPRPARPPAARRSAGHHRLDVGQRPGGRSRPGHRRRHPPAGLHHRLLDRVLPRRHGSCR